MPMQKAAISAISQNDRVILLSPTGSGKTLAYLIPAVEFINPQQEGVQVMVIAPSRELVLQIEQYFKGMGTGIKVNGCYGGHPMWIEEQNLSQPPALLVGTPGRLLDHLQSQNFNPASVGMVILDEFDKALEFGFHNEMSAILQMLPNVTKRVLISATQTDELPEFARMDGATTLSFLPEAEQEAQLSLHVVRSAERDKAYTLLHLLYHLKGEPAIVFLNHREAVERIYNILADNGVHPTFYHGGLEQHVRERALVKFRNGSANVLVCTDLASRGLDIPEVKHIIHYHLPTTEDAFVHRNGRTARMNATGASYLVLSGEESVPAYIAEEPTELILPNTLTPPKAPRFTTLYIGKGKKDKVNKIDVVGFLTQKGGLRKEEIGLIESKDFFTYVAVASDCVPDLLMRVKTERIKNMKTVIEVSL